MKVAILGYGSQGQSAFEHWSNNGSTVTICDLDTTTQIPKGALSKLGPDYLSNLGEFDLLIRTPIMHPSAIAKANPKAPNILDKVWSNTNEFFKICPSKNIVAVTGTKGKGTTSTLIAKMLEAAGKRVHLGGNIGIPPLELLKDDIKPEDWVVLELANFQLIDLKFSPHIAVVLMVEAEHLDWHEDVEEYIAAKQQMFIHQEPEDIAIYYAKNEVSESIADASMGKLMPYFEAPGAEVKNDAITIAGNEICKTNEIKLLGTHNWQNACAATTAVWQITQDTTALRQALTSFSGLPFRIEFRREVNGVRYYNDSFATGQGAMIAALEAIHEPKVMIIGGYDRMLDLSHFGEAIKENEKGIRKVLLIGAAAERCAGVLKTQGFTNFTISAAKTMPEVVSEATKLARSGDAVVLSPAFASFDMFKNFEERGKAFNQAVEAL
jgi:UDP-N-acetylmuramoylalanine--D-glutamate ligase